MEIIKQTTKFIHENGLYPEIKVVQDVASEPEFTVGGNRLLSFASFNYLGLANNEEVKAAIIEGLRQYGIHPSASPLVGGTLTVHRRLEDEVANLLGKEDCMLFATSTMANMGVIPALVNLPSTFLSYFGASLSEEEGNVILFSDEPNHATIVDGIRLARTKVSVYRHCDMDDLEKKLRSHHGRKRKVILSDGVFSMDGDIAPLNDIVSLAEKYEAMVFVDDVNAIGLLGENGGGTMEHFGLKDGVDVVVTNFAKALGVGGGAAAASRDVIDYLRVTAKTYIFSGALLGGLAMGVLKALEVMTRDKMRRAGLWENTKYLRTRLQAIGFNTLKSETPIIPIFIGDERIAIDMYRDLLSQGIFSPALRWPAVPHGEARLRFVVTYEHSKEQLDRLIGSLHSLGTKYRVVT